jgi:type IV pilus assembly protein PilA
MREMLTKKRKKKGFTLIELIVVIGIMAILAAIAIPNLSSVRENAKIKADNTTAAAIKNAVNTLVADEQLPSKLTGSFTLVPATTGTTITDTSNLLDADQESAIITTIGQLKAPQSSGSEWTVTASNGVVTKVTH